VLGIDPRNAKPSAKNERQAHTQAPFPARTRKRYLAVHLYPYACVADRSLSSRTCTHTHPHAQTSEISHAHAEHTSLSNARTTHPRIVCEERIFMISTYARIFSFIQGFFDLKNRSAMMVSWWSKDHQKLSTGG
jgi:hypothetical protein